MTVTERSAAQTFPIFYPKSCSCVREDPTVHCRIQEEVLSNSWTISRGSKCWNKDIFRTLAEFSVNPSTNPSGIGNDTILWNPYGGACNLQREYTCDFAENQDNITQINPLTDFPKNPKT